MSDRPFDFDVERFLADRAHLSECLEILRERLAAGDQTALLAAMHLCLLHKAEPPEWLRLAFIHTYQYAARFKIGSWDEAFGLPVEKGTQREAERRYADLRLDVAAAVVQREPGQGIDPALFEKIGGKLKISSSIVKKVYYERGGKKLAELIEPFLRRA